MPLSAGAGASVSRTRSPVWRPMPSYDTRCLNVRWWKDSPSIVRLSPRGGCGSGGTTSGVLCSSNAHAGRAARSDRLLRRKNSPRPSGVKTGRARLPPEVGPPCGRTGARRSAEKRDKYVVVVYTRDRRLASASRTPRSSSGYPLSSARLWTFSSMRSRTSLNLRQSSAMRCTRSGVFSSTSVPHDCTRSRNRSKSSRSLWRSNW